MGVHSYGSTSAELRHVVVIFDTFIMNYVVHMTELPFSVQTFGLWLWMWSSNNLANELRTYHMKQMILFFLSHQHGLAMSTKWIGFEQAIMLCYWASLGWTVAIISCNPSCASQWECVLQALFQVRKSVLKWWLQTKPGRMLWGNLDKHLFAWVSLVLKFEPSNSRKMVKWYTWTTSSNQMWICQMNAGSVKGLKNPNSFDQLNQMVKNVNSHEPLNQMVKNINSHEPLNQMVKNIDLHEPQNRIVAHGNKLKHSQMQDRAWQVIWQLMLNELQVQIHFQKLACSCQKR